MFASFWAWSMFVIKTAVSRSILTLFWPMVSKSCYIIRLSFLSSVFPVCLLCPVSSQKPTTTPSSVAKANTSTKQLNLQPKVRPDQTPSTMPSRNFCSHSTSLGVFFQRRSDLLQLLQKVHVQQPRFKIAINGTAHVQHLNVIRRVPGYFCSVSS